MIKELRNSTQDEGAVKAQGHGGYEACVALGACEQCSVAGQ